MPTVTYTGPFYTRRNPAVYMPDFIRGQAVEVSQGWLDTRRRKLGVNHHIEGDAGGHVDLGDDGIPDSGWTKAEIVAWLSGMGVEVGGGYKTKTTLLGIVEEALNPAPVEEPVVEAAVEEVVADTTEEE